MRCTLYNVYRVFPKMYEDHSVRILYGVYRTSYIYIRSVCCAYSDIAYWVIYVDPCIVYDVHYTLYVVHCTYNVRRTLCIERRTLYAVHCTMYPPYTSKPMHLPGTKFAHVIRGNTWVCLGLIYVGNQGIRNVSRNDVQISYITRRNISVLCSIEMCIESIPKCNVYICNYLL